MFNFDLILYTILPFFKSYIGMILFIPFYAAWVTLLLPGVWVSMLAGALYGTYLGSVLVFFGGSIGAIISFILGRTLFRNWVQERLVALPKLQLLLQVVSKEGVKLIVLTRLSPVFPFGLLNFAYGLSEVSLKDYIYGLFAIIPGTILFCGLGSLAGEVVRFREILSSRDSIGFSFVNIIGILSTLLIVLILNSALKRIFQDSDLPV